MRLPRYLVGSILALVLIGAASYCFPYKAAEAPSDLSLIEDGNLANASSSKVAALPLQGSATLEELYEQDKNLICNVTSINNNNGAFSGKVYLTEDHLRGDYAVQQGGRLFSAGMFIIVDMFYFWTDTAEGRVSFKVKTDAAVINDPRPSFSIAINEAIAYDCEPWGANLDAFTLPTDLGFPEVSD